MPFYIRRLPVKDKHAIVDPKANQQAPNITFFNPSRAGDMVCVRMTEFADGGRTQKNKMLLFNGKTQTSTVVEPPWSQLERTINLYQGIEDVRLCWFENALWFSATSTHASSAMTNEILVGYFSPDFKTVADCSLVDIGSRPVKNLCPFVLDDQLCLWDAYKTCIYRLERCEESSMPLTPLKFKTSVLHTLAYGTGIPTTPLRGSTSPIHLHGNLWGCVVHDIIFYDLPSTPYGLSYIHYWMEFRIDPSAGTSQITFLSQPFFIAHWGVEYVSGIQTDPMKDIGTTSTATPIRLYFGVDDKIAMECTTTLHDLRMGKAAR
jgi:hypothetical protein